MIKKRLSSTSPQSYRFKYFWKTNLVFCQIIKKKNTQRKHEFYMSIDEKVRFSGCICVLCSSKGFDTYKTSDLKWPKWETWYNHCLWERKQGQNNHVS